MVRVKFAVALSACTAAVALAHAQFPDPGRLLSRVPGLRQILEAPEAVSTNLSMAVNGVEMLDRFTDFDATPMTSAPRTADGGFALATGIVYEMHTQSFCLQAGTRAPGHGDGYLDAPLAGPMGEVVQHILDGLPARADVPQESAQMLLWAIIAHAKISDLPRDLQLAAARLLTPSELVKVNGGALGLIPDSLREEAFARLPPAVAHVAEAEADLRDLISQGAATYDDMARIAMREGDNDDPGDDIPAQRWNYRNGVYVRYQPNGYSETVLQAYIPRANPRAGVTRDGKGRIVKIVDDLDRVIQITYDDATAPRTFDGDARVRAWHFTRVAYAGESHDVDGWTLTGMPNGRGRIASAAPRFVVALAALRPMGVRLDDRDLTDDLTDRYKTAAKHKGWYDKAAGNTKQASADDVTDVNHYEEGLEKAKKLDIPGEAKWLKGHNESLGHMAAESDCKMRGACSDDDDSGPKPFKPSGGVAVPAYTGAQRLGQSGRSR